MDNAAGKEEYRDLRVADLKAVSDTCGKNGSARKRGQCSRDNPLESAKKQCKRYG